MFTECTYIEGTNNIIIELGFMDELKELHTIDDIRNIACMILEAVDSCDTYLVSEDFEAWGNDAFYLRLININRDVMYYLDGKAIERFKSEGKTVLKAHNIDAYTLEEWTNKELFT